MRDSFVFTAQVQWLNDRISSRLVAAVLGTRYWGGGSCCSVLQLRPRPRGWLVRGSVAQSFALCPPCSATVVEDTFTEAIVGYFDDLEGLLQL